MRQLLSSRSGVLGPVWKFSEAAEARLVDPRGMTPQHSFYFVFVFRFFLTLSCGFQCPLPAVLSHGGDGCENGSQFCSGSCFKSTGGGGS